MFNWTNIEALSAGFKSVQSSCVHWGEFDAVMYAWTYQTCTQLPMPQGQSVQTPFDFALPSFYQQGFADMCKKVYGVEPKWDYALDVFGGRKPEVDYKAYSNIVFSNGDGDPWSNGGILENISPDLKVFKIKNGAHHYDLMTPNNETDTAYVQEARDDEINYINQWLKDWKRGYDGYIF